MVNNFADDGDVFVMVMFLWRERSLLVVGLWGEVLEDVLGCSIKNKVPVPCCLSACG